MNRKNTPYSLPCDLQITFVSYFRYFAKLSDGTMVFDFKPGKDWERVAVATNSLTVETTVENAPAGTSYKTRVSFKISFAEPGNQSQINYLLTEPLIVNFCSGAGKRIIVGDQLYPCIMQVSQPAGWDGYQCELECTQLQMPGYLPE